jgi:hypothetical protein
LDRPIADDEAIGPADPPSDRFLGGALRNRLSSIAVRPIQGNGNEREGAGVRKPYDAVAVVDLPIFVCRLRRLIDAGFGRQLAADLAASPQFDLHELIELVERDCPPRLAARILAPLDGDPWPRRA